MINELAAAIENGRAVVLATVVRTERSVPRRPGSKMLVFSDGSTVGTIGGGEMEHRVTVEAAEVLADGRPRVITYTLVDPASGDAGVCGGEAEIYMEPYMPTPKLLIIGAGHVGRAVSDLAQWLDFRTLVWDDREAILDDADHVDVALTGSIADALREHPITTNDSAVMVTRNVKLDLEILPALLETPVRYIGLMGSQRRWDTTRGGLIEQGLAEDRFDRIHAPIGVEINAETPEEIAVSILAEVIGDRRAP
jgi:xanthine dehydrogenase accessory factor